jgi:hypothetical protein
MMTLATNNKYNNQPFFNRIYDNASVKTINQTWQIDLVV